MEGKIMKIEKTGSKNFSNENILENMTFLSSANYTRPDSSNIINRIIEFLFPNKQPLKANPVYIHNKQLFK